MGGQSENFPHAAGESTQRYLVEPEWMNSLESSEKPSLTLGLWQSKWWSWQSCWRQSICLRIKTSAGTLRTGGESQPAPLLLHRLVHWSFIFILFIFVSFIYLDMSVKVRRDLEKFSKYGREGREGRWRSEPGRQSDLSSENCVEEH